MRKIQVQDLLALQVIELLGLVVLFTMKYRWHIENILVLLLIANLLGKVTVFAVFPPPPIRICCSHKSPHQGLLRCGCSIG